MTLLEQLQAAAENARKGIPAALTIDADGVQYTRNFMPGTPDSARRRHDRAAALPLCGRSRF